MKEDDDSFIDCKCPYLSLITGLLTIFLVISLLFYLTFHLKENFSSNTDGFFSSFTDLYSESETPASYDENNIVNDSASDDESIGFEDEEKYRVKMKVKIAEEVLINESFAVNSSIFP
jgi:hypothetical protein